MKSIDEIRDEVAIEKGWESYSVMRQYLAQHPRIYVLEEVLLEVAERYKNQAVCAALDNAAEKATANYKYVSDEWDMNRTLRAYVNKESILGLKPTEICPHDDKCKK